jgi:hypothetical protein
MKNIQTYFVDVNFDLRRSLGEVYKDNYNNKYWIWDPLTESGWVSRSYPLSYNTVGVCGERR